MKNLIKTTALFIAITITNSILAQSAYQKTNQPVLELITNDSELILTWNLIREVNSSYFLIERSVDSVHYSAIRQISAYGSSTFIRNYHSTELPIDGISFYRIVLVDMNGVRFISNEVKHINSAHIITSR